MHASPTCQIWQQAAQTSNMETCKEQTNANEGGWVGASALLLCLWLAHNLTKISAPNKATFLGKSPEVVALKLQPIKATSHLQVLSHVTLMYQSGGTNPKYLSVAKLGNSYLFSEKSLRDLQCRAPLFSPCTLTSHMSSLYQLASVFKRMCKLVTQFNITLKTHWAVSPIFVSFN